MHNIATNLLFVYAILNTRFRLVSKLHTTCQDVVREHTYTTYSTSTLTDIYCHLYPKGYARG